MRMVKVVLITLLLVVSGLFTTSTWSQDQFFIRGDVDADGDVDQADADMIQAYFYYMTPVDCHNAGDVNDDGMIMNMGDYVTVMNFIQGGDPPLPPYPDCGTDPTDPQPGEDCCTPVPELVCGDIIDDDDINIADLVYLVNYMFKDGPAPEPDVCIADVDGNGEIDIADLVYLVNHMWKDGPAPVTDCCTECSQGETQPCYEGPQGTQNQGMCSDGTQSCIDGYWGPCEGQQLPEDEACDGVDNDCDGETDEGIDPQPCPMQEGVCGGAMTQCDGPEGEYCDYGPHYEETETSCDGLDNDCDGVTDEGCR